MLRTLSFRGLPEIFLVTRVIGLCQLLALEYRFFAYRNWRLKSVRKRKMVCFLTGRGRGLVSCYGVSRLVFKTYVAQGSYSGLKKFVW
jgi:ribosomal protein S14